MKLGCFKIPIFQVFGRVQRCVIDHRSRYSADRLPVPVRSGADPTGLRPDGLRSGTARTGPAESVFHAPVAGDRLGGPDVPDEPAVEPKPASAATSVRQLSNEPDNSDPWWVSLENLLYHISLVNSFLVIPLRPGYLRESMTLYIQLKF